MCVGGGVRGAVGGGGGGGGRTSLTWHYHVVLNGNYRETNQVVDLVHVIAGPSVVLWIAAVQRRPFRRVRG